MKKHSQCNEQFYIKSASLGGAVKARPVSEMKSINKCGCCQMSGTA